MKFAVSSAIIAVTLVALLTACVSTGPAPQPVAPATPSPAATITPAMPPRPSPSGAPSIPAPPPTGSFKLTRNVQYGMAGGIPLLLDIYAPANPLFTPVPGVVFIHGGGWAQGDKYPSPRAESLAKRGFLAVSINYRLSGAAPFPAAIEDSKCAIRWLRAHAGEYKVDADRIGVWGSSAGGHLSLLAGTADASAGLEGNGDWVGVSSRVQAICSWFGPSDFVTWYQDNARFGRTLSSAETKFLGGTMEQKPEAYKRASPVTWASTDDPPLIMFHGDQDRTVPLKQSQLMYDAYRKAGLDVTLVTVRNAGHGFGAVPAGAIVSPTPNEIDQAVADFFLKYLGQSR